MAMETYLRVIPMGSDPWVAIINGIKYSYPAGTEQYVPGEVAVLIDAQNEHEKPKYPPAQGGGGDMLVTITAVMAMEAEAEPQYVADKTFAEILEAIESGKNVRAMFNMGVGFYLFNLATYEPNAGVMFSSIMFNVMGVMILFLMIDSAGNVTTEQKMI